MAEEPQRGIPGADCPLPGRYDHIVLGHGGGGQLSAELLRDIFLPAFGNPTLHALEDQATVDAGGTSRIAITTDAFVVRPLFFPGGDIGRLAVCGTVNDLATGGATPRYLTAAFILEEGLPLADLQRIAGSMRIASEEAGIQLVAGDTKVVDRGKGDGVFITTTGVGTVPDDCQLSISAAKPGDRVLVSGTLGDHGVAILSVRENLEFETPLTSDVAPLNSLCEAILSAAPGAVRGMRDATRGGLTSVLNELATASKVGVRVHEDQLPINPSVRGACEILGLDPMHIANEGKLVVVVAPEQEKAVLEAMRAHPLGGDAAAIGDIIERPAGRVTLRSVIGGETIVPLLAGELLPRIC